jgi:Zn-dependent protease with chaperone function
LFIAWIDIATLLAPSALRSQYGWAFYAAPLLVAPVALPLVLRRLWRLERVAPVTEQFLRTAAEEAGVRVRNFLVWEAGDCMNAAVCGVGRWRCMMFTAPLLEFLPPAQLAAVFHHEAAHIRRGHLALRLLVVAQPLFVWMALQQAAPSLVGSASDLLLAAGLSQQLQLGVLSPLLIAAWLWISLGATARWLEFDADLSTPRRHHAALATALKEMADYAGYDSNRRSWLHPAINARIYWLRMSVSDANVASRLTRRTGLLRWALVAFSIAMLLTALAG